MEVKEACSHHSFNSLVISFTGLNTHYGSDFSLPQYQKSTLAEQDRILNGLEDSNCYFPHFPQSAAIMGT